MIHRSSLPLGPLVLISSLVLAAASHGVARAGHPTSEGSETVELDPTAGWTIQPLEASHSVEGMTRVAVHNPWGEIRIRRNDSAEVRVVGNAQRPHDSDYHAEFDIEPVAGELVIRPRFVRKLDDGTVEALTLSELAALQPRRRIDMTLLLPDGIDLRAEVLDDRLQARGLHCNVRARARDGNVELALAGALEVHTRHGQILADLSRKDRFSAPIPSQSKFVTTSGDVYLWFDWFTDVAVQIDTEGRITSDVSLDIERPEVGLRKIARAEIGSQRSASPAQHDSPDSDGISIESRNGSVHLLVHTP